MKKLFFILFISLLVPQESIQYIDGVAAIVENHIILKSDLAQMINMAAIQRRIDPRTNPEIFIHLQNTVLQSMVDQKILLEMAVLDSIEVGEKDVEAALDQQIEMLIAQAGGEEAAEETLGQSIKSFRREFWFDMQDRLISEKYQQKLMNTVSVSRGLVKDFYKTFEGYKEQYGINHHWEMVLEYVLKVSSSYNMEFLGIEDKLWVNINYKEDLNEAKGFNF